MKSAQNFDRICRKKFSGSWGKSHVFWRPWPLIPEVKVKFVFLCRPYTMLKFKLWWHHMQKPCCHYDITSGKWCHHDVIFGNLPQIGWCHADVMLTSCLRHVDVIEERSGIEPSTAARWCVRASSGTTIRCDRIVTKMSGCGDFGATYAMLQQMTSAKESVYAMRTKV